jgi:hypothetical protein
MTIRDPEVIELLGDSPELLAIADAVSATQPEHAGWASRRRIVGVVAVVAALVVGIVAVLLVPQGRHGVVDRALAAIGGGPITHVVADGPTGTVLVNLETGERTIERARLELWADRQMHHLHLVLSMHGRPVGEFLWPQDARSGVTPRSFHPAFAALWSGYRAALENGTGKLERKGSVDGHAIYWLRFAPAMAGGHLTEVAVDAHTYKPILYRTYTGSRHYDQRILVAETIGYEPADFTRRSPGLVGQESSSSVSSGSGNTVVRAPWLTAGETVVGLKLGAVNPLTATRTVGGKRTSIHGIELVYGPLDQGMATVTSTTIDELPLSDIADVRKDIPAGFIKVGTGASSGPGGTHELWVGSFKKHGLYVTIKTPVSERAVLTIARSLHAAS